jgi:hypothetical protein
MRELRGQNKKPYFGLGAITILISTIFPVPENYSHDEHVAIALQAFGEFVKIFLILFFGILMSFVFAIIGLLRNEQKIFSIIPIGAFVIFLIFLLVLIMRQ